jgi:hypothetical protein
VTIIFESGRKQSKTKKRGIGGLIIDLILVFCTGGVWLIWLLIQYLRNGHG